MGGPVKERPTGYSQYTAATELATRESLSFKLRLPPQTGSVGPNTGHVRLGLTPNSLRLAVTVLTDLLNEFADSIRTLLASHGHFGGQPRLERRRLLLNKAEDLIQDVLFVVHHSGVVRVDSGAALLSKLTGFTCWWAIPQR